MLGPLRICVFLLGLSGARAQLVLTQSSPEIKKPGESTKLTCTVSGFDLSSYNMFWIRQAPGKGLEWLIYYYSSSDNSYSPAIQGRFTASKNSSNFYLHMTGLEAEDTAVYYCARHTARRSRAELRHKPRRVFIGKEALSSGEPLAANTLSRDRLLCLLVLLSLHQQG